MVKPIFLYLKSAKMSRDTLKAIEAAGYLPVQVARFNDVKFVEPVCIQRDIINRAARETLEKHSFADMSGFGKRILQMMAKATDAAD